MDHPVLTVYLGREVRPVLAPVDVGQPEDPAGVGRQPDGLAAGLAPAAPAGVEDGAVWAGLHPRGQGDVQRGLGGHHVHAHQLGDVSGRRR